MTAIGRLSGARIESRFPLQDSQKPPLNEWRFLCVTFTFSLEQRGFGLPKVCS